MSLIPGLDTLKCVGVALMISGATSVASGVIYYAKGKKADKQRSDLVISRMVTQYQQDLLDANARADSISEAWKAQRQGADRAQDRERAQTRAALAAVISERDGLRDDLARAATGGVEAAGDTVAACRERTATFGRVLGEALQAHAECTAAAEDNASGVRTLLGSWPNNPAQVTTP